MITSRIGQISLKERWLNKHHPINVIDLEESTEGNSDQSYNSDKAFNDVVRDTIEQSNKHESKFKWIQTVNFNTQSSFAPNA